MSRRPPRSTLTYTLFPSTTCFRSPNPGLELALEELRIEGFRLAICTNKPEGLANHLVEALGWAGVFDAIIGGDTLPVRKPDPLPLLTAITQAKGAKAIYVGDSAVDVATAKIGRAHV